MTTTIKAATPARAKTNPARGLFSRKVFPLGSKVPLEGGAVAEDVSVIVTGPFDPVDNGSGVDVGESEDTDDTLFGSQHLARMMVGFNVPGSDRRGKSGCGL